VSVSSRLLYDDHYVDKGRPALLDSVLTFVTPLVNICAARGRHWIVTAFMTAAVTTSTTLVAIIIYMIYVGLTGSAWEEHCALKEAHVDQ
jgi:hypothetical protein